MADLVRSLPAPQREYVVWQDPDKSIRTAPTPKSRAPPYGRRRGFVPRSIADFGDGGAFPEIHVAQYPLGMGTKEDKAALGPSLDPLLDRLPADSTTELPQLNWHEKPHWPDKLFFAGRGHKRRHAADAKFSITPPRYDRME